MVLLRSFIWLAALGHALGSADVVRLMNLVHNNPGDALGQQQTRFQDTAYLKSLGYTADVTTNENSAALVVDFPGEGLDFWPVGSPGRAWREAQLVHLRRWVNETKSAGLAAMFWLDLVVFPAALLERLGEQVLTNSSSGQSFVDFGKAKTKALLADLFSEMFRLFPDMDGVVVRTGETYVYDTPFHRGNSPVVGVAAGDVQDTWVEFITFLRQHVAEQGRHVFFRTWDNFDGWTSSAKYYSAVMDRVPPHPKLLVSVKQEAGDYFRYAAWNPQIGVGKHGQVIEISAQRSWEGKGAYPNYMADQVVAGYQELPLNQRIGLDRFLNGTVVQGIWVWARGDGWWGPYLKGQEVWPALMAGTLARYWLAGGELSEAEAFADTCQGTLGLGAAGCSALRRAGQIGANATLLMRYCPEIATVGSACWGWYRDDRVGGLGQLGSEMAEIRKRNLTEAAVGNRRAAVQLMREAQALLAAEVEPQVTDISTRRFLRAHAEYGVLHFSVVEAGWRVMLYGLNYNHTHDSGSKAQLQQAIADYDASSASYLTLRLEPAAPSLFFDYYFNLPGQAPEPGLGATVDEFRALLRPSAERSASPASLLHI